MVSSDGWNCSVCDPQKVRIGKKLQKSGIELKQRMRDWFYVWKAKQWLVGSIQSIFTQFLFLRELQSMISMIWLPVLILPFIVYWHQPSIKSPNTINSHVHLRYDWVTLELLRCSIGRERRKRWLLVPGFPTKCGFPEVENLFPGHPWLQWVHEVNAWRCDTGHERLICYWL